MNLNLINIGRRSENILIRHLSAVAYFHHKLNIAIEFQYIHSVHFPSMGLNNFEIFLASLFDLLHFRLILL